MDKDKLMQRKLSGRLKARGKKQDKAVKNFKEKKKTKAKTKLVILAGGRGQPPMAKERVLDKMKSEAQAMGGDVKSMAEMEAATKGLKTLTSKGPGRLKIALRGGGRAYNKNS